MVTPSLYIFIIYWHALKAKAWAFPGHPHRQTFSPTANSLLSNATPPPPTHNTPRILRPILLVIVREADVVSLQTRVLISPLRHPWLHPAKARRRRLTAP